MYSSKTEIGEISIAKSVFAKAVIDAAKPYGQNVMLCNSKGKAVSSIDSGSFIEVSEEDGKPAVKVFVLIRFGASINKITSGMISGIEKSLKSAIGVSPSGVSIVVMGVVSKNVARRNIEVTNE